MQIKNNPSTLPFLLTMGDVAGIGPEIIALAYRDHWQDLRGCVVAGDVAAMRRAAQVVGGFVPVAVLGALDEVADVPPRCIPVMQACQAFGAMDSMADVPAFGRIDARAGRAAAECIAWATAHALHGRAAGLVTAPIHKEAFHAAGLTAYPGHTEYLQALAAQHQGCTVAQLPVRMMLANPELQTVLLSIHVPLRAALEAVTVPHMLQTLTLIHAHAAWLARGRNVTREPLRVAVAGLNPHAGEGGLLGREEIDIIAPAIAQAQAMGWDVRGPIAPDTVFMRARTGEFDVVLAMYHDQGLIPVKYLGVDHGVNVTLGLPFIRSSPDHGTAFDVAGQGIAKPDSLLAAVAWATQAAALSST
jgi:4-hydroxythreonine-4-phosphate dehydrogenase